MRSVVGAVEVYHTINASKRGVATTVPVRVEFLLGQNITAGCGRRMAVLVSLDSVLTMVNERGRVARGGGVAYSPRTVVCLGRLGKDILELRLS